MKEWIELIAVLLPLIFLVFLFDNRKKTNKGIGVRVIQFTAVVFIVSALIIFGLEGILNSEIIATLLGTIIGYTLSSIEYKDRVNKKSEPQETLK